MTWPRECVSSELNSSFAKYMEKMESFFSYKEMGKSHDNIARNRMRTQEPMSSLMSPHNLLVNSFLNDNEITWHFCPWGGGEVENDVILLFLLFVVLHNSIFKRRFRLHRTLLS